MNQSDYLAKHLTELLHDLESVEESLPYHPEENTMQHSLQAFDIALKSSDKVDLIAAALLHDIGKARAQAEHAAIGADLLRGVMPETTVWFVEHHMDLHYQPRRTRHQLKGTQQLIDLEQLRQWDLKARVPGVLSSSVEYAAAYVCENIRTAE